MRPNEYATMFRVEETHWWYGALHRLIFQALDAELPDWRKKNVLDVGCGTGAILKQLGNPEKNVGIDLAPEAISFCRQRGLDNVQEGDIHALRFADASFDAVIRSRSERFQKSWPLSGACSGTFLCPLGSHCSQSLEGRAQCERRIVQSREAETEWVDITDCSDGVSSSALAAAAEPGHDVRLGFVQGLALQGDAVRSMASLSYFEHGLSTALRLHLSALRLGLLRDGSARHGWPDCIYSVCKTPALNIRPRDCGVVVALHVFGMQTNYCQSSRCGCLSIQSSGSIPHRLLGRSRFHP